MTIQEIADYLEENKYPMNNVTNLSTENTVLFTGLKGGYLFHACIINYAFEEVNKELLDSIIKSRKPGYNKTLDRTNEKNTDKSK